MSQDYTRRLRELAEDLHQEAARLEVVGRALTRDEMRRVDALRTAEDLVLRALRELESGPPARDRDQGGVMRGDDDSDFHPRINHERSGPLENTGLAGDDDTPGYGRGGRGGR